MALGCDFISSHTNTQIYNRTLENNCQRMVSSVFLFFSGWFCWHMDNTNAQLHTYNFLPISSSIAKKPAHRYTGGFSYALGYYHNFALFLIFCCFSTHTKTHTQTMSHRHHHAPLSSHSASSHVLCAIPIVATVKCPPPSLL